MNAELGNSEITGMNFKSSVIASSTPIAGKGCDWTLNYSSGDSLASENTAIKSSDSEHGYNTHVLTGTEGSTYENDSVSRISLAENKKEEGISHSDVEISNVSGIEQEEENQNTFEKYSSNQNIHNQLIDDPNSMEVDESQSILQDSSYDLHQQHLQSNLNDYIDNSKSIFDTSDAEKSLKNSSTENIESGNDETVNRDHYMHENSENVQEFQDYSSKSESSELPDPSSEDSHHLNENLGDVQEFQNHTSIAESSEHKNTPTENSWPSSTSCEIPEVNQSKQTEANKNNEHYSPNTMKTKDDSFIIISVLPKTASLHLESPKGKTHSFSAISNKFKSELTNGDGLPHPKFHSIIEKGLYMDSLTNKDELTSPVSNEIINEVNEKDGSPNVKFHSRIMKRYLDSLKNEDESKSPVNKSEMRSGSKSPYVKCSRIEKGIYLDNLKNKCKIRSEIPQTSALENTDEFDLSKAFKSIETLSVGESASQSFTPSRKEKNSEVKSPSINDTVQSIRVEHSCITISDSEDSVISTNPSNTSDVEMEHTVPEQQMEHQMAQLKINCGTEMLLKLFSIDNNLCKNILLALKSKHFAEGITMTELLKYLKEAKAVEAVNKREVREFLNIAVNGEMLQMKSRRYFLLEGNRSNENQIKTTVNKRKIRESELQNVSNKRANNKTKSAKRNQLSKATGNPVGKKRSIKKMSEKFAKKLRSGKTLKK